MGRKLTRICIGLPSHAIWKAAFGVSLVNLVAHASSLPNTEVGLSSQGGSILPNLRQACVRQAKTIEATHLLFIDADMIFPYDFVQSWLEFDKDVIAANCAVKNLPSHPTARKWAGNRWIPVYSTGRRGFEQIDRVGTGIMMIKMEVFDRIPEPHWEMKFSEKSGGYQGEDWYFAEKLERAGVKMYVDHTMSLQVLHIGDFNYGHKHIRPELIQEAEETPAV